LKKLLSYLLIVLIVFSPIISFAEYTYTFSDIIPHSVQDEAVQYMLNLIDKMTDKDRMYSYSELLDMYLKFYGIYSPESLSNNNSVMWVQDTLMNDSYRVTFIPDHYVRSGDLSDWVKRYAEPGDLLLYKQNGRADKCIIYAGNGLMIGRANNKNMLIEIRATFAANESYRNKSGGLFAIAHIWTDHKEEEETEKFFDLQLVSGVESTSFSQNHYTVWEATADNSYVKSTSFILFEYSPGVYRFWNGSNYGFSDDYISKHNGIHLQIASDNDSSNQIHKRMKIDLYPEQINSTLVVADMTINNSEDSGNTFQWTGSDLLNMLGERSDGIE